MKAINLLAGKRQRKVNVSAETSFVLTVGELRHQRSKCVSITVDPKGKRHIRYWRNEPRVFRSIREDGKLSPESGGDFHSMGRENDAKNAHQSHLPQQQEVMDPDEVRLKKAETIIEQAMQEDTEQ